MLSSNPTISGTDILVAKLPLVDAVIEMLERAVDPLNPDLSLIKVASRHLVVVLQRTSK
jgi:hypothetical protein